MDSSSPQVSKSLLLRLRQTEDVVFTTPAIRALRQRFPDAHLSYIVETAAAERLLARDGTGETASSFQDIPFDD